MTGGGAYRTVDANGARFEVLTAGEGDRLALCLHGFPEHAISWRHQLPLLVRLGYRVWAPNQRGYGNSFRPAAVAEYDVARLLDDVAGLIDASKARSVTLLGHDWGATVAWLFATRRVRALERLVILNVPHPALFARSLRASPRQRLRSWYMGFFQLPWLPERLLGFDRARGIGDAFLRTACDRSRFPSDVVDLYRSCASEPGALTAMLNWYRAAPAGMRAQFKLGFPPIDVPTLMLWGENDAALGKETTYGTHRYASDLRLHYLPGVSHWVQQEAPERVNEFLEAFLTLSSKQLDGIRP